MELFQVLWDLGIAPINMILALAGLVMLFVLRATAKADMEDYVAAKNQHNMRWKVMPLNDLGVKYCHGLYEEYKAMGHNNVEAWEIMDRDTYLSVVGSVYRPFLDKPLFMTRILMLRIGGKH